MQKRYKKNIFGKILVPIVYGCECKSALAAAQNVVGEGQVLLVGFVCMPEGESLSGAAVPAREVRQILKTASFGNEQMRASEVVFATHNPWEELLKVIKNN